MMMVNLYDQTKTFGQSLYRQLSRTKHVATNNNEILDTQLNRCLDTFSITLLGIGHMVGSGVYVLTASIAKDVAGPSIVVSYIITGFASLLSALCYSEFAVKLPRAGSAYSYAYIALGEFFAFIVGWSLIMENCIGIAAISRSCSGYFDSLLGRTIQNHTIEFINENITTNPSFQHLDPLAVLIVFMFVGFLTFGIKVTSYINNVLAIVNIFVIFVVVLVGSFYADIRNWQLPGKGFAPNGWHGIFSASASCFYAYIGFDSIATSGEEAKNPQKSIPIATFISMCFATIAYVSVSAVLTLMVPFNELNNESGLPDALGRFAGAQWAKYLVICGASCGMISVLIGTMYSLTRIVYAMASDGLLYPWMSEVNQKTQIPLKAMYFFAVIGAALAFTFELTMLVEMMSIGTLLAYLVVSASVIVARYQPPDDSSKHQVLDNEEDEEPHVRCTEEQELSEMSATNGTSKPPVRPTDSNRSSSSSSSNETNGGGEFRDIYSDNKLMSWLLKYDWLYRKFISLRELKRELNTFKLKKYPAGGSRVHLPTVCVFVMTALIFLLCSLGPHLIDLATSESGWYWLIILVLALMLAVAYSIIALHEQNTVGLRYKVPCVPFVPTLSILFNVVMMTNLNNLTWLRLVLWMIVGFFIYFAYGIKNSTLNPESKSVKKEYRNWGSFDSDSDKNPVIVSNKADF